jgi:hypothetical protein
MTNGVEPPPTIDWESIQYVSFDFGEGAAVAGFQTGTAAGATGLDVNYVATLGDLWETGTGVFAGTMARTELYYTSADGNAKGNFPTPPIIRIPSENLRKKWR